MGYAGTEVWCDTVDTDREHLDTGSVSWEGDQWEETDRLVPGIQIAVEEDLPETLWIKREVSKGQVPFDGESFRLDGERS